MKREDFIATVGYSGEAAIVDAKMKRRCAKLTIADMIDRGLFRPAFCAAIFDGDTAACDLVLERYNKSKGTGYQTIDELKRVFGVDSVPTDVTRIKAL